MKRKLLPLAALFISGVTYAQVGIGTLTPNKSAQIEIVSSNRGMLIPRVALQSPADITTISAGNVESLLVYNTTANALITPGYYYWFDKTWVRLVSNADASNLNNTTNVLLSVVADKLVLRDSDGNTVSVPLSDINAADIVTTLINNGGATYTYTSEDGTKTVIDVPADVINNFEEILQDNSVVEHLITYLTNTYVGGNVYYDGTKFTYVDKQGNVHNITFEDIVQANETLTILAYNPATGILTYSDEKKNITALDIKGAISNFETITTLTPNYAAGTMTYLNEAGTSVTVDIKAMVAAGAETITTLVNNGKGKYTYTSEDKTVTVIDVPADVINNFEEIIKNTTVLEQLINYLTNTYVGGNVYYDGTQFTYVDKQGNTHIINFADIVQANETLTILAYNQATGILTYSDEKKNITSLDIKGAISNFETITTLTPNYAAGTMTYLNEAGTSVTVDIKAMVAAGAETITTLVNNGKGKYTYTSEDKTVTVIDVPADVINNFEEIIQNNTVLEQLINYLTKTYVGGNVYYDGTQFTYVDKQGNVHNITFEDIVQANETLTILAYNQATGILTYSDEKKNITSLDIKGAISNFETITTLTPNYAAGTMTYLNEAGTSVTVDIKAMVAAGAETITTLVNNGKGKYTYTSEDKTVTVIDVPADVINNFEEILQDNSVVEHLINYLTKTYVGGNVYYDGTQFTYVDKQGNVHNITFEDIVQANETLTILGYNIATGILTYQDEKKGVSTVDIKGAVKSFETLTSLSANAANGTITFVDEDSKSTTINIKDLVGMSQTITTFIRNANGTYTYTNEANVTTTIDPSMVNVTYANGIYTFKDNLGNNLTEINTNASNIIYNNTTSGLTAVNVQNAIDELVLKLNNVPTTKGSITGTGITVTNGTDAALKNVQVAITPGSAGQILATNSTSNGTIWVDTSSITPVITNALTKQGANTLVSTVNGSVAQANLVESVVNAITGSSLVTTVNGVASTALDLTTAVQAGQKTVTVADGENTTVTSSVSSNNTEYKVNVSKGAIQGAQKTTVVTAGTGIIVTPNISGDQTTYMVATDGTGTGGPITLAGDVTGLNNNTVVGRIQTTPVSAVKPNNGEVLTFDGTNWKPTVLSQGSKGSITGTGITVTNGVDAALRDVQVAITPGSAGQMLVTNPASNGTMWVDTSSITPVITNALTKQGANTLVSTVNGSVAQANLVESVVNAITGSSLVTTVNGVASTALDLTTAVQAGQKTVTLANGENTTVTSSVSNNNTEYKVNVSKGAIQGAQKTTIVTAGTGIIVTPNISGDQTTYMVATDGTGTGGPITLAGDVTGLNNNTVVGRIQTTPVSAVKPNNGEVLTFDGTNWKPTVLSQGSKGSITGTGITVTNGADAALRDVQVAITPGSAGQMLVTNPASNGTMWVDTSSIVPTITNSLTKQGANTLVSTVNGSMAQANLVESVVNSISGISLITTVNGVASSAIDLTNVIQTGQKTVTVADGENTTVTSSNNNNNTEYKVNVSKAAIQAAQKLTIVAAGTGITVTPTKVGDETTYTVATTGTTTVTLAGDVTGPTTNSKVERIQTVPVSATAPRNNEVLTYDGTSWKPALPTVDAGTITNGKALSSTDLDLQGDPNTSLLKAVTANIKTGAVTSEKILDGTIKPIDMNSEGNNLVLTTDASGRPTWINKSDLNQATQKTSSVSSTTTSLVVTPKVSGDNTDYELTVKSAMPKFFYMPAVIFDTNTNGTKSKNLYTEYTTQFGGGGGMISSAGASGSIPVLGSNELEFYVTYYDPAVFSNLSISANGILTYTVIGKATRASYMNIVFVVK